MEIWHGYVPAVVRSADLYVAARFALGDRVRIDVDNTVSEVQEIRVFLRDQSIGTGIDLPRAGVKYLLWYAAEMVTREAYEFQLSPA